MPKILPSVVKGVLSAIVPQPANAWILTDSNAAQIAAICDLLERIPDELLTLGPQEYADFLVYASKLHHLVGAWERNPSVQTSGGPVIELIRLLDQCADSVPAPTTTALAFITDAGLRKSIRLDISGAWSAIHNGEFKAATVLGGAAVEALLLWAIVEADLRSPGAQAAAVAALPPGGKLSKPIDRWGLEECIAVAHQMSLIEGGTRDQAKLAQDARNLIHPGRAQRLGSSCDRATALTAATAVERIAQDLGARFP